MKAFLLILAAVATCGRAVTIKEQRQQMVVSEEHAASRVQNLK
jgi:hypothetical protein